MTPSPCQDEFVMLHGQHPCSAALYEGRKAPEMVNFWGFGRCFEQSSDIGLEFDTRSGESFELLIMFVLGEHSLSNPVRIEF